MIDAAMSHLTPQNRRRAEWKIHMLQWVVATMTPTPEWVEQLLDYVGVAMSEAHAEGLDDAADLVAKVAINVPSGDLKKISEVIAELAARDRASAKEVYEESAAT